MQIAIVKLSALGDIIHAMIVLQYIKKMIPNIQIDWFVEEKFVGILENNPHIRTIYPVRLKNNTQHFFKEYQKLRLIAKKYHYDFVLDLQGLIKSAIVSRILSKNCIGFDKKSLREPLASLFYKTTFTVPYEENVIIRNLNLVCQAFNLDLPDCTQKELFLFTTSHTSIKPILLVIVGSSWKSKMYPKEHFVSIINALNVISYLSWGNEAEKQDAEFIAKHTHALVLPSLTLNQLKDVVQNSALVIGGDSGPTHIAWASNKSSITIFGPTPSSRNTLTTPINKVIDCNEPINPKKLDKKNNCIKMIKPEKIIVLAKKLLSNQEDYQK